MTCSWHVTCSRHVPSFSGICQMTLSFHVCAKIEIVSEQIMLQGLFVFMIRSWCKEERYDTLIVIDYHWKKRFYCRSCCILGNLLLAFEKQNLITFFSIQTKHSGRILFFPNSVKLFMVQTKLWMLLRLCLQSYFIIHFCTYLPSNCYGHELNTCLPAFMIACKDTMPSYCMCSLSLFLLLMREQFSLF